MSRLRTVSAVPVTSEFLELADRRIEYRLVGERLRPFDIVMLHEGLGSVAMWKDFPERLAQATGCRVLVYSRHGYGASSALEVPRATGFMHDEARIWLPRILELLAIERPVLFGHSDGASIALIHGASPAANLSGIVALAPHVDVEELSMKSIERARQAYLTTDFKARLARYHADVDSAFWGWNRIWLDPAFRQWSIEDLLPLIRVPVLAIQGEDDEYGTLRHLEAIRRALPLTATSVLAHCGHSPHRDHPETVIGQTVSFIERLSGAGSVA